MLLQRYLLNLLQLQPQLARNAELFIVSTNCHEASMSQDVTRITCLPLKIFQLHARDSHEHSGTQCCSKGKVSRRYSVYYGTFPGICWATTTISNDTAIPKDFYHVFLVNCSDIYRNLLMKRGHTVVGFLPIRLFDDSKIQK